MDFCGNRLFSLPSHTLVELWGEKRVSFTWHESITCVTSSMVMEVSALATPKGPKVD